MAFVTDRCICLRRTPFSETSQILALLSRGHGLVHVIAKGAHRRTKAGASKFDGGVDMLDLGEAVFTFDPGRDLNTLTEWSLRDGHLELRSNLRTLYLALYAAELMLNLTPEGDAQPDMFDRFEQVLLDLPTVRMEELFLAFELDLLREAGLSAELSSCVMCGRVPSDRESLYFSPARGGVLCRTCGTKINDHRFAADPRLLRVLQQIARPPNGSIARLPKLTRHQTDPINRLLAAHVQTAIGRPLRMVRHVVGS